MIINYNLDSILAKIDDRLSKEDTKKRLELTAAEIIQGINPARVSMQSGSNTNPVAEAASTFCDIMKQEIYNDSELSDNAKDSISSLSYGRPKWLGGTTYSIDVWFEDVSRKSIYPSKYPEGVDNIAALFNFGVNHEMSPVFGWWHSYYIKSKTHFPALNFYERAIKRFKESDPKHIQEAYAIGH